MNYDVRFRQYREYIEDYLKNFYSRFDSEPQKVLFDSMKYSLLAGGKRLRPIFAFEFCRLCSGDWKQAAPFAGAIEMIHTYSPVSYTHLTLPTKA